VDASKKKLHSRNVIFIEGSGTHTDGTKTQVVRFAPHKIISSETEVVSADLSLHHSADPESNPHPNSIISSDPLGTSNLSNYIVHLMQ